ncbi:polysaccharide deacetylase family protein [uncultured Marinobacter sp.]|uniref:polysaccharide deacetylase family protein n=1 Tax=uncultured Marinobacter sp. TaxID=187379 RepID=UPI0026378903|nr:polysaccharide deacetylase family protein [uncultured Marinobacter sp.]
MVKITTRFLCGVLFTGGALSAQADLVVLQYHHVSNATPPATSTSISLFDGQLEMIEDLQLEVVPLQPGTEAALNGELTDRKQVAITFDDAYESVYTKAAPRLAHRDYPYTIFVNTNAVGGAGYMTWAQLRELGQKAGVTIANHSHDHGHLAKRPDESQSQWEQRVETSLDRAQSVLEETLGTDAPLFAYPYGEFDVGLEAKLAERGWFGFGQQSGAVGENSGPTRLPRFPMANAYGQLSTLKDKLLSKALPVDASTLPAGVITNNPPTLEFTLPEYLSVNRLACFASGQGRIDIDNMDGGTVRVTAPDAFNSRRFRYNCTHPADDGSYYWLSQQWLDLSKPED